MSRKYTPKTLICSNCNKQFETTQWYARHFCSKECRKSVFPKRPIEERFLEHINRTDGCWLWTGSINDSGYGVMHTKDEQTGRSSALRAHRFSYEYYIGPIPKGLFVCHVCDNPPCVNPVHLFVGTQRDNMQDKVNKGRSLNVPRGEYSLLSKLTEDQVMRIRDLWSKGGMMQKDIAVIFDIHATTVENIVNRKTWKHI